jgi:DNA topoisomerase-2
MSVAEEPIISVAKDDDFTQITFVPDLSKFRMTQLDDDTIALLARRAYDIAGKLRITKNLFYEWNLKKIK